MELLGLHEAAQLAGVSYPTLKQWIYNGKIKSVKTAGGHHGAVNLRARMPGLMVA